MLLKIQAPLDPGFMPMSVYYRDFLAAVDAEGGEPLTIGLERNDGLTSVFTTRVFKDGCGHDEENYAFVERLVKTLLWTRGGYKLTIAGSEVIADRIRADYSVGGAREFDRDFMSGVYEAPFEVLHVPADQAPVKGNPAEDGAAHKAVTAVGAPADGDNAQ